MIFCKNAKKRTRTTLDVANRGLCKNGSGYLFAATMGAVDFAVIRIVLSGTVPKVIDPIDGSRPVTVANFTAARRP